MNKFLLLLLIATNGFAATTTTTGEKILAGKKGSSTNVSIEANTNAASKPALIYDKTAAKWKKSDNGTDFYSMATDDSAAVVISASNIDWSLGNVFTKTLSANTTFTFSNVTAKTIIVWITNTASNYTVTWPTAIWSGGVAPVQTIGAKTDICTFTNNGTTTGGSCVQDMY